MKYLILSIALVTLVSGCEKLFFKKNKAAKDPRANFEYLWKEVHDKYSYLEVKQIDWSAIYSEYSAQISDGMTEDELFTVLGNMLDELRDGHVNLVSPFNLSLYEFDHLNQDNFDWRMVEDNYLPEDYYISGPFAHDFLLNTNEQIGYIRFAEFDGSISDENLDFALQRYANTKGIILDIRENGGGYIGDVFRLLSRFTASSKIVYYSRIKTGPGAEEFSEPESATLNPHNGAVYTGKVILLTDRGTFSAASYTTLATKALTNFIQIGDTTGGGLGLPNGGQLPNGWTYRFPISQGLDLHFDPQFEKGVPPVIQVNIDWTTPTTDEIIERAKTEIL